MSTPITAQPKKKRDPRNGLKMSASLATVFTILGHTVFGFEQPVAQVFVALITGYSCAFFFEWIDAKACGCKPAYEGGGWRNKFNFLLAPHMTSITLSFLLYFGERMWIMALTVALAIGSKHVFRVRTNGRLQHFMNPSNFGIAIVLITYQWTGVLPWNFTVDIHNPWDILVPLAIVMLGTRLNLLFTGRVPSILSWLGTFILLGIARSFIRGTPLPAELVVLTGIPMVLFTFYMITDPQTSPSRLRSQILFGCSIAVTYFALLTLHVQYMMFYSVTIVCAARGACLLLASLRAPVPIVAETVAVPEVAKSRAASVG
jgi:hypothetical protein